MADFQSQAAQLRTKAEHCKRLARDTIDPSVRRALETMADEYADAAELVEGISAPNPE